MLSFAVIERPGDLPFARKSLYPEPQTTVGSNKLPICGQKDANCIISYFSKRVHFKEFEPETVMLPNDFGSKLFRGLFDG